MEWLHNTHFNDFFKKVFRSTYFNLFGIFFHSYSQHCKHKLKYRHTCSLIIGYLDCIQFLIAVNKLLPLFWLSAWAIIFGRIGKVLPVLIIHFFCNAPTQLAPKQTLSILPPLPCHTTEFISLVVFTEAPLHCSCHCCQVVQSFLT